MRRTGRGQPAAGVSSLNCLRAHRDAGTGCSATTAGWCSGSSLFLSGLEAQSGYYWDLRFPARRASSVARLLPASRPHDAGIRDRCRLVRRYAFANRIGAAETDLSGILAGLRSENSGILDAGQRSAFSTSARCRPPEERDAPPLLRATFRIPDWRPRQTGTIIDPSDRHLSARTNCAWHWRGHAGAAISAGRWRACNMDIRLRARAKPMDAGRFGVRQGVAIVMTAAN